RTAAGAAGGVERNVLIERISHSDEIELILVEAILNAFVLLEKQFFLAAMRLQHIRNKARSRLRHIEIGKRFILVHFWLLRSTWYVVLRSAGSPRLTRVPNSNCFCVFRDRCGHPSHEPQVTCSYLSRPIPVKPVMATAPIHISKASSVL